jgi:hypothetical protein
VLFLDVEGAFPNAVTDRLIHNLRKRRIPETYIRFIQQLLTGRRTRLKFDDFVSESIAVLNGIGQGDPLSMILYILYNADLLEITGNEEKEDSMGFVDDIAFMAIGRDLEETTNRLRVLMTKEEGGKKRTASQCLFMSTTKRSSRHQHAQEPAQHSTSCETSSPKHATHAQR